MTGIADCRWREPGGLRAATIIAEFLAQTGIPLRFEPVADNLLPGVDARHGAVFVDPTQDAYPGDLLHEAGHLAVTESDLRDTLEAVPDDPGEEMAAIAWSAAAAKACGIGLDVLFHDSGYGGGAQAMRSAFAHGDGGPGVPMLKWFGMVADEGYPRLSRWLR